MNIIILHNYICIIITLDLRENSCIPLNHCCFGKQNKKFPLCIKIIIIMLMYYANLKLSVLVNNTQCNLCKYEKLKAPSHAISLSNCCREMQEASFVCKKYLISEYECNFCSGGHLHIIIASTFIF